MSDAPNDPPTAGAPWFEAGDLARVVGGTVLASGRAPIRGGAVDSRRVTAGVCFFALPGEQTDGQLFVAEAIGRGAAAAVVRDAPDEPFLRTIGGRVTVIQVPDALAALQAAARAWRDRFDPLVVGVTGSIAKTSTKEQIAEVLVERFVVLRNEGNENNEVGLPLTLLRLLPEHRAAVLEMGMYAPTHIAELAVLARPAIGVVTSVRTTHLSRAGSIDAIERGKSELIEALPLGGTAILNADDGRVVRMRHLTAASVLTYGFDPAADVGGEEVLSRGEYGMSFTLRTPGGRVAAVTPALGRHSVHNALAAAAVGISAGLDQQTIVRGIARGFRAPHRTAFLPAGEWRILDDSYNAAPDSMIAALDLLATLPGRRIAVLGEMLELGPSAAEAHAGVGRHAAARADVLVSVGEGAAGIADGAIAAGAQPSSVHRVRDHEAAVALLIETLRPGDVVLVKASRGAALERIVDALVSAAAEGVAT